VQVLAEPFDALRATTWATALILIFFVISHDYSMPVGQQLSFDYHDGASRQMGMSVAGYSYSARRGPWIDQSFPSGSEKKQKWPQG
jgi:hypothetical protein